MNWLCDRFLCTVVIFNWIQSILTFTEFFILFQNLCFFIRSFCVADLVWPSRVIKYRYFIYYETLSTTCKRYLSVYAWSNGEANIFSFVFYLNENWRIWRIMYDTDIFYINHDIYIYKYICSCISVWMCENATVNLRLI